MLTNFDRKSLLLLVLLSASANVIGQSTLSCEFELAHRPESMIRPRSRDESVKLLQSPHGAKRLSKRELQVNWAHGAHIFKVQPPYDADLDGVTWAYCGYSKIMGLHLIEEKKLDLFTGVLLDDNAGKLLPAGEKVLFSSDKEKYLAFEQPDGQDGATIKLFTRNGTLLWSGFNGFLDADGKTVVAEFHNVHWNNDNQLVADVQKNDGKIVQTKLAQSAPGKWQWLPNVI